MLDMLDRILQLLASIRPESDFRGSSDYISDGMLDSFDIVTLVSDLDGSFDISIPGTEIIPENFRNAEAILALVQKYQKPK
jgi:acyl carrier protein